MSKHSSHRRLRLESSSRSPLPLPLRQVLLGVGVAVVSSSLVGCYSELEDEERYTVLKINTDHPRTPNKPPVAGEAEPEPTAEPSSMPSGEPTSSSSSGDFTFSPGCEDVVGTILGNAAKCGGGLCHGGPGTMPVYMDFGDPEGLRERIVDKPGDTCKDALVIDSANPEQSLIFEKLKAIPSCGMHMPVGGDLPPADIECLTEWVNAMANGDI
jgi:hypothetical protein